MKYRLPIFVLLMLCACGRVSTERFDVKEFRNPSASYHSMTFWSLNDSLRADEMRRQIVELSKGGFGGVFLHSRTGLLTPYLSDEWFDLMAVGVDELQKQGMESWFYDEDKWPSGFAGGIVPRQNDEFRAKTLVRVPIGTPVEAPDKVVLDDGKHLYVCHYDPMGQPWYNGASWVDLMNPDMVDAFLDCTYKPYAERFAGKKSVMGIFSDEPQVSPRSDVKAGDAFIPYSNMMEAVFREMWGYDMDPHLASLVDTVGNWRTFRLHYYRTVGECMERAFSAKIGNYCNEHDLLWTGHFNGEEHPCGNMWNEGNLMRQFRNMQVPGVDALGLRFKDLHNGKVMTSVANQYGKQRRIVEIFGVSGHNMSFEDRMWITAWHTNCGINMQCPHLSLYAMKGVRKHDFPPTFSYQQPYWPQNHLYEDFAARLCYFATAGATKGEVCVLSTLESDYVERNMLKGSPNPELDDVLEAVMQKLVSLQFNVDIGDEQIISDVGSVKDGRFHIGEMNYHTVILPSLVTLRPSTYALLEQFSAQGGKIVVVGDFPEYLDGVPDPMTALRASSVKVGMDELGAWLDDNCPKDFKIEGEGRNMIWTHLRNVEGGHTLQLSNTSRTRTLRFRISTEGLEDRVALLNPVDGKVLKLEKAEDGSFELEFAPASSWVLAFGKAAPARGFDAVYHVSRPQQLLCSLDGEWTGKRLDANAMPVDFAEWSTDGGESWNGPEPVLAIYSRFRDKAAVYNGPMILRYHFNVSDLPAVCSLAVEQPWMYKSISINGNTLSFGTDYYVDSYFRTADVAPYLKEGGNEVLINLDFVSPISESIDPVARYGTEIETIYLCGDFAVNGTLAAEQPTSTWRNRNPRLNPKPMPARFEFGSLDIVKEGVPDSGNVTLEGYPFYAGSFEFSYNFKLDSIDPAKRYSLAFPKVEAITVAVKLNGKALPVVFCSPWELDVTDALHAGENALEITLTGSLRNLMGPYHNVGGELSMPGPASFTGADEWPNFDPGDNDWYELRKFGKTRIWRDDYYCIPFGLMENPHLLISEK